MRTSIVENLRNLGAHWIIKISLVLHNAHMIPKDQDKFVFYINNYIDWDQFNQLYDLDWMKKGIRNTNAVAHKLGVGSTRATNDRLEIVREERRKKEEMIEKWKVKAIATKWCGARRGINLSSKEENESNIGDDTNLD